MNILITGASGLLGVNLALAAAGQHQVTGVVNQRPLQTDRFAVRTADLRREGALVDLLAEIQPAWVVHCAALANLEDCERDPELAWELNSELPRKLAIQCQKGGARLLHVSTDAVFDGARGGYTEADAPNPLSVYARSKLAGEQAVAEANPDAIIARVNLFGWSITGKRSLAEFFYYNLAAGKPLMGFTDVYFCPLEATYLAEIFLKMLEKRLSGLYHVVSSQCLSKYDFGVAIAARFGLDPGLIAAKSVVDSALKAARSPNLTLRVDKLIHDLGEIPPTVSTGIEHFYTLFQQDYPQVLRGMTPPER